MEMIALPASQSVAVRERSQVGEARRLATQVALRLGMSEELRGRVAIVATELATNLALHGGGGELVVSSSAQGGLELLALDRGPGMDNVERCLSDGYSTGGTAGQGLGAVRRLSPVFDLHSRRHPAKGVGGGTAVFSAFPPDSASDAEPAGLELGAVCVAVRGESECGDSWDAHRSGGGRERLVMADGLGHGPLAAEASQRAIRVFRTCGAMALTEAMSAAHHALRATRGAAVSACDVDPGAGTVRYCGVGNISARILHQDESRSLVSMNGTLGLLQHRMQDFTYPWAAGATLVMHSDGLISSWSLDAHPGLLNRHPSLVAGVLYRDFARGRDDAAVLVARARTAR